MRWQAQDHGFHVAVTKPTLHVVLMQDGSNSDCSEAHVYATLGPGRAMPQHIGPGQLLPSC